MLSYRQLADYAETLEDKVQERTLELADANLQLESANQKISTLNEKLTEENIRLSAELGGSPQDSTDGSTQ